ncbi:thiamine pyrophosphokinase [Mucilaginibacter sp. CSA2-8R]|uniref:thiamine pyrophosphokinase n=1 Tax=Mucilaginibacter sp. CSA2-8R TaxID=3141542 RepID=UPI00315DB5DF
MSSHHIVREKQEPALLILSLENFGDEDLGQLLEWSPTLIATLPVAEQLVVYGIKVDLIVANPVSYFDQSDVKWIPVDGQSNLQAGLDYLLTQGYPAVNIITDRLETDIFSAYINQINLVIFYQGKKIYAIASGFSKWRPAGQVVEVLSSNQEIAVQNLKLTAPQQYQTIADGVTAFTFQSPRIFISEEY